MRTDLFICTYRRDFQYLRYCLRSIEKFARGFGSVVIGVPGQDFDLATALIAPGSEDGKVPISVRTGDEWPGKGFLWHESQIMRSPEWCPQADYIAHMDADCVFTEPVKPEDYFVEGKPVLVYAPYAWLVPQQENLINWKVATQNALGFPVEHEFMRRHPAVHLVKTYIKSQLCITDHHRRPMDDYIREQKDSFPQTFAEFNTLGAVAWKFFHDDYHWINQEKEPLPHSKLYQCWSHRAPTEQDMTLFKDLGLT